MEFYEAINNRKTIREFENEVIPEDVIERIISAAFKAPTNDHMRDWHYIIVRDKNVVVKLLDIIPKGISDEDMEQLIKDWNLSDLLLPPPQMAERKFSDSKTAIFRYKINNQGYVLRDHVRKV